MRAGHFALVCTVMVNCFKAVLEGVVVLLELKFQRRPPYTPVCPVSLEIFIIPFNPRVVLRALKFEVKWYKHQQNRLPWRQFATHCACTYLPGI